MSAHYFNMENLTKQQRTFIANIQKKIGKTVFNHNLIGENDKVLVGLSGGKDSFVLLDALASRRNAVPYDYTIIAAHVDVTNVPYKADIDFMQELCDSLGVEFHLIEIAPDFENATGKKKLSQCFVCSWNRRTELFKLANRLGCSKVAFGHHLDDSIETLLMNMAFNGEISAMPHRVEMFDGKFEIIRPMLETEGKYIAKYARLKNFNREIIRCPFAKVSKRETVRNFINDLEKINKNVRLNIFKSMNKIVPKYLPEAGLTSRKKKKN